MRRPAKFLLAVGAVLCIGGIIVFSSSKMNQKELPEAEDESQEVSMSIDCVANVLNYNYTSMDYRDQTIRPLKDCEFSFLDELNIPGMPETKEEDLANNYIYSVAQCPQGLCFTDEYMLITSYSEEDDCLGELMVFDRESGRYLVTLGMDSESHLGGIAFDGKNVWVCNSSQKTLERLSYDFIQLMATENEGDVVDASEVVDIYDIGNRPSCVTFYRGRIWIATFHAYQNGEAVAYHYDSNKDTLIQLSEYEIPPKVQGITFAEDGTVYLSCSYGRKQSSYIKRYDSVASMAAKTKRPSAQVEMPPGSEEIVLSDGALYVVFESAGEKYLEGTDGKGTSLSPINKILKIEVDSF